MAKRVYAYTDMVPESSLHYLTPGKRYEALRDNGLGFEFVSDTRQAGYASWSASAHLEGGNWTREEVEETP